jgi:signal transduction histidine kinase
MLDGIYASGAPFVAREWAARSARWGRDRYFDFSCQPIRGEHGEVAGLLIHLVEVTAQVNARTALERAAEERERLIAELQRTVKFSEMFVGILGHDLRNPLNAITTGATLLQRRSDSERVQQPAGRILNSAERMARMIDQLLDFTRIRLGRGLRLQRRTVALEDLCVAAADELRSLEAEIRLSSIGDTRGLWDSDRLIQLLSNLLANAIQHRHPGTPVDLKVDGTDPERVLIDVHNSGAVDPVLLPVMFEPFRGRDDHKVRGSSGLGLGLFITHQIAAAHKGRITVASSASDGTTLRVELPRNAPVTADEQAFTPSERVTS